MLIIGLFGTCGGSKWREPFIAKYEELGIPYFNPQVPDWKPELAVEEARHLAQDKIILFPITRETYAIGSLGEVGFSILNALKLDDRRDIVIMIEAELDASLADEVARRESLRLRKLVVEHLKKLRFDNVYLVDTLEEMLELSIVLYQAALLKEPYKKFTLHHRG